MINDTIAAIATPAGNSGIGIIRVSGDDAKAIVDRIFVNSKKEHILSEMESHTIRILRDLRALLQRIPLR